MRTQNSIIREYANGIADGFLNDLAAGHIKLDYEKGENGLIGSFIDYVSQQGKSFTS